MFKGSRDEVIFTLLKMNSPSGFLPPFCSDGGALVRAKCIFGEHSMIVDDNTKRTESVGSLVGLLPVKLL